MAEEWAGQPGIPALATSVRFALATAQIIKENNGIKAYFSIVSLCELPYQTDLCTVRHQSRSFTVRKLIAPVKFLSNSELLCWAQL